MSNADGPVAPKPTGQPQTVILEQYKAYLADLTAIGSRYATAQSFYLTMVSALFGIVMIKSDVGLDKILTPLFAVTMIFIAGICYIWRSTIIFYDGLFYKKFTVLRQMEQEGRLFPVYEREAGITERDGKPLQVPHLIETEAKTPLLIGGGALILGIVALYYLTANT